MSKSTAIRAGRAFVELFADDKRLVRGLRAAERKIKAFGAGIRNLGLKMAGLVAAAVVAGGVALAALGTIISGLGSALGGLIAVVTGVGAVFKILAGVVAFLLSPIGAVITALPALGAYLVYATSAGGKALAWLGERFNVLKEDALTAYQGIADALAAGDISLAVKVLWLTLKMEWTRGINFLEKAWLNFRNFFIRIGYDAWHGLLAVVETVWHGLEVGWIETTAFFSKAWQGFVGFFARTWQRIKAGRLEGVELDQITVRRFD